MRTVLHPAMSFAAAALLLVSGSAVAQDYQGRVFKVSDGDTIKVNVTETCAASGCPETGESLRVRFAEIDAPESDQPYGDIATQRLRGLIGGESVDLKQIDTDRYGRVISHVIFDGTWVNAWLVGEGHAWVYRDYAESPQLFDLEDQAKAQQRGLWQADDPVAPWVWRHR